MAINKLEKLVTVIIPCAGKSSRYPNLRPKFLLVNPNGNLMFVDSISGLELKKYRLIVTILKEHQDKYKVKQMINKFFKNYKIRLCVLDQPTSSQSETICLTIKKMKITGPILIKDSDNIFTLQDIFSDNNYVAVDYLGNIGRTLPAGKSYVVINKKTKLIKDIAEKEVISGLFCAGGYYFKDCKEFIKAYEDLSEIKAKQELYISEVIKYMINNNKNLFYAKRISKFIDLDTVDEWVEYKKMSKTYFIDIDGVIVKNSGEYSKPYWGSSDGILENIKLINKLYQSGNQIILVTSRKESYRDKTAKQLKRLKVKFHSLLMGLYHSQRVLINDFTNSNPYPSAVAINIPRDSENLKEYLNL